MLQSLYSAVANIKSEQTRLNTISSNLSNVNTTAYKGSSVSFEDVISQTISTGTRAQNGLGGTNPTQYGLGVKVAGTRVDNQQGSLDSTGKATDLAIQGAGYFEVSDGSKVSYTRDGGFEVDSNGDLVQAASGQKVLGWTADSGGKIDTTQPITAAAALNIPVGKLNATQATTQMTVSGNLKSGAKATDSYQTSIDLYDSLGGTHSVDVVFTNTQAPGKAPAPAGAASSVDWTASESGNAGTTGTGTLYFDSNGKIIGPTTANLTLGATSAGAGTTAVNVDFSGVGSVSSDSSIAADQNGFPPGSLTSFAIGGDGVITGTFSNGLTRALGQIAMASFTNADGLVRDGSNLWSESVNSGAANTGAASTGGRGSISAGYLEQSNVDIASEFSNLIVDERGFQANSKIMTTVDEMLQDLVNMKR